MAKFFACVALFVLWAVFGLLRFSALVLLILMGVILRPLVNLAVVSGLMLLLLFPIFAPGFTTPMWAGLGLAVGGVVMMLAYDAALAFVAPDGMVIFHEW